MIKDPFCYFNGKIIKLKDAKVHASDLGIIRGYGVFDSLFLHNSRPFLFEEHYQRLVNSAKKLNLKIPLTLKEMFEVIIKLSIKNKTSEAAVRTIMTGSNTFFILFESVPTIPQMSYIKGAKLILQDHQRFFPTAKTTNYIQFISLQNKMKKEKAVEILYSSEGKLLECGTSNIFLIKGNTLITPKDNILIGMTRNVIIALAKSSLKVEEREVLVDELKEADECFLTSSFKGVCPIVKIDNITIGKGKVGEHTKHLMKLYREELEKKTSA